MMYQPRMTVSISNAHEVRRSEANWNRKLRMRNAGRVNGAFYPVLRFALDGPSRHIIHPRWHSATEQDQADLARGAFRDARLALRLARLHGRGHGAPGLRRAVRGHAAWAHRHERRVADAAGDLADRHGAGRARAMERSGHDHEGAG